MYDQTGAGPEALGWDLAQWAAYIGVRQRHASARGRRRRTTASSCSRSRSAKTRTSSSSARSSASPPTILTAASTGSRGLYLKKDDIKKVDRFIGENFLGAVLPGGNNPLSTLSGENRWVNDGEIENYAGFAQIGFKFTDTLKLSVGARYTHDKKAGNVSGFVVATGDRFSPNDPRPNVTIEGLCRTPDGTIVRTRHGRPARHVRSRRTSGSSPPAPVSRPITRRAGAKPRRRRPSTGR